MTDDDALLGAVLAGKYRVKRCIGRGGMGAVYEAENVDFGKRVAVKVIARHVARSSELAARFRREARAASAVESAHIVHVFDVGEDPEHGLYMVMELLTGEDLASRIAREGRLAPEAVIALGVQAARTLADAHAAGVVHRDLKPANLFLTTRTDGALHVKILDFGISKLRRPHVDDVGEPGDEPAKASTLTHVGMLLGTPQYMSPEQAQGLPVDARSDVWSLGAVLYEALAGRPAFGETRTTEQMIIQIVTTKPAPLADVAPWVPVAIAEVIHAALVHDVEARLPSAARLADELAVLGGGAPSGTDVPRTSAPRPVQPAAAEQKPTLHALDVNVVDGPSRRPATRPIALAVLGLVALVGAGAAYRAVTASDPRAGAPAGSASTQRVTAARPAPLDAAPKAPTGPLVTPVPASASAPAASSSAVTAAVATTAPSATSTPTSRGAAPVPRPRVDPGVGHTKAYE